MLIWADAVPNLLIGLREGLEAGLVVTILLAALRKAAPGRSSFPIWIGVVGAVSVAGSFAAVLSFSTTALGSSAQEAVGGALSVVAVGLVTWMVFWMRRTARGLSGELTAKVDDAARIGTGALAVTAFLAVGREGLETTLFIWTAARASGTTVAPVVGALVGIGLAVLLCWLLFRGAVRLDLGVFFSRTAVFLLIIAAGILAYGLGDLQDAGLLPGQSWIAFDFSESPIAGSWWVMMISGITELQTRMTVLSVAAWAAYLAVFLPLFLRRPAPAATPATPAEPAAALEAAVPAPREPRLTRLITAAERRGWLVITGIVVVPAAVAVGIIAVLPADAVDQTPVSVTASECGQGWTAGIAGTQTFAVSNRSARAAEVNLDDAGGAVVAEIETLGPATSADMTATLSPGSYQFRCLLDGQDATSGPTVTVTGRSTGAAPAAVIPATVAELTPANDAYQAYAAGELAQLQTQLAALAQDVAAGDAASAKTAWLQAQQTWEQVGASYDSFGDLGEAVDALPIQFEGGVGDPQFTGLHRVEYDLWDGAPTATLSSDVATTQDAVSAVQTQLSSDDLAGDPTNLPIRAHEIIEDAVRDHLAGIDDEGSGASFALAYADTLVDRVVIGELATPIDRRAPRLVATADAQLSTLQTALLSLRAQDGSWTSLQATTLGQRQRVDAAAGALLETLARIPDLLEVPPSQQ